MTISDVISIISAVISLIVAVIIAVVQYKQGKRMEEFSKKQDEEQKRATAQRIKAERDSFIMKYYNDDDEIYMLPLCWIASIYDPAHAYHRKMYMEYNMLEEDVQKAICEYMNLNLTKPNNDREEFYSDCVEALKKAEYRNNIDNAHRTIYYDNAKYFERTFKDYGNEKPPIELNELQSDIAKLLNEYNDTPRNCPDPITDFLYAHNYYLCDGIEACEICTVLSKILAEFYDERDSEDFWIPGEYSYETLDTMEDLFLCALFCTYVYLIMPKKKGNEDEQS